MANNCYNFITIEGSEKEIKEFSKLFKIDSEQQDGFDIYENLVFKFRDNNKGEDGKWFDIYFTEIDKNNLTISGDSAWVPCLELLTAISEFYPSFVITYEYSEMGCDFAGYADILQGKCNDNQFTYWEGIIQTSGASEALEMVINNELSCYESEEELTSSDMYNAFSKEHQEEILGNFIS